MGRKQTVLEAARRPRASITYCAETAILTAQNLRAVRWLLNQIGGKLYAKILETVQET
ncbi:hypothetical protein PXNS11_350119 [Stutzerimonas xanthomarina]|nr:hypothetical protein PXNS11_350119 [Stutzerimonas xanthomarina]